MIDDGLKMIEMELLDRPKRPDRLRIDPEGIRELAESIREQGLLEPIIVRDDGERYEIIMGDRRFLAHQFLERDRIKCIIFKCTDNEMYIFRAIENIQRENLTPIEEARVYHNLREEQGLTVEEISRKMGKNRNTIKKYMRLLLMDEVIQAAVDAKQMSIAVAATISEVEDEDMRNYYAVTALENGVSAKVARIWVEDYNKSKVGRYYETQEGEGEQIDLLPGQPIYITCGSCLKPVEVSQVKQLQVCPDCMEKVRETIKEQVKLAQASLAV